MQSDKFAKNLTSKQLKVKPKSHNITGLPIADLIAHPSFKLIEANTSRLSENYHQGPYLVKKAIIYASKCMISSMFGAKIRLARTFPTGC